MPNMRVVLLGREHTVQTSSFIALISFDMYSKHMNRFIFCEYINIYSPDTYLSSGGVLCSTLIYASDINE